MGISAKVGSFTKTTGAATASQAVTGVGFQPTLLLLFTVANTATNTVGTGVRTGIGMTVGASTSRSVSEGCVSAASPTNTSQRGANKALTIVAGGESLVAECDLTSFDSDGFTLSWTTNDANAYHIGYLALGGSDLTVAIVDWTTATALGSKAITGAGFAPDAMLTIGTGITGGWPASSSFGNFLFSAAAKGFIPWAFTNIANDNSAGATVTRKCQELGLVDASFDGSPAVNVRASLRSWDSDGVTLQYAAFGGGAQNRSTVFMKFGAGYGAQTGAIGHTTAAATAAQDVNLQLQTPSALLLATAAFTGFGGSVNDNQFSLGVTDGTSAFAMAHDDPVQSVLAANHQVCNTGKGLIVLSGTSIVAECGVPSFAAQVATLSWTTNLATNGYLPYFAIGSTYVPAGTPGIGATNLVGGVLAR